MSIGSTVESWLAPASVQLYAAAVMVFYVFQADSHGHTRPYDRLHRRERANSGRYRRGRRSFPTRRLFRTGQERCAFVDFRPKSSSAELGHHWNVSRHYLMEARDRLLFHLLRDAGVRLGEALSIAHGDVSAGWVNAPF